MEGPVWIAAGIASASVQGPVPPLPTTAVTLSPRAPDVPCRAFRTAVDEQLDGSPDALQLVQGAPHLRRCSPCLAWVAARHAYRRMMQRLGEAVVAPLDLRDRIRGVLQRETARDAQRPNA